VTDQEPAEVREHAAGDPPEGSPDAAPKGASRPVWRTVLRWAGRVGLALLAVVVCLAAIPSSGGSSASAARPATSFEDAVARVARWEAADAAKVFEPCRSRLLSQGRRTARAVVLFHGLTNCPQQFVAFAQRLVDDGANVLILRAPHHGLASPDGSRIGEVGLVGALRDTELAAFADEAVDIAVGLGERVDVLGLSMGGVLTMWAAQHRAEVDRAVVVAPAIAIPVVPSMLTTAFLNLFRRLPNVDLPGSSTLDHAYAGGTTRGLVATFGLARSVQRSAERSPAAARSVVIVLNDNDEQVNDGAVRDFAARWRAASGPVTVVDLPIPGMPHDVIDPDQPSGNTVAVYPFLWALLDGPENDR
jgi:carboxylesterase